MDVNELRKKAKEYMSEAVKYDKLENYEQAYDLYVKAANQLHLLIKNEPNRYNIPVYEESAKKYVLRAKEIEDNKLNKSTEVDEEREKLVENLKNKIKELKKQLDEEKKKTKFYLMKS